MDIDAQTYQNQIPIWMKIYFWDTDITLLDVERNKVFIIERLLNAGDEKTLSWLFGHFTRETIREAVSASRGLSIKTARCWQNYFQLKEEEMRCFGIFSTGINERF